MIEFDDVTICQSCRECGTLKEQFAAIIGLIFGWSTFDGRSTCEHVQQLGQERGRLLCIVAAGFGLHI